MRVIDIHTHPILRQDRRGRAGAEQLIARAKAHGIRHIVALGDVLAFGRSPTSAQIRTINDETHALMLRHPDFVTGFCHLNPTLGAGASAAVLPEDRVRVDVDDAHGGGGDQAAK
jgi:5,10-methylenetetrahydrofolate reductase